MCVCVCVCVWREEGRQFLCDTQTNLYCLDCKWPFLNLLLVKKEIFGTTRYLVCKPVALMVISPSHATLALYLNFRRWHQVHFWQQNFL